jgi:hypothetical protein
MVWREKKGNHPLLHPRDYMPCGKLMLSRNFSLKGSNVRCMSHAVNTDLVSNFYPQMAQIICGEIIRETIIFCACNHFPRNMGIEIHSHLTEVVL